MADVQNVITLGIGSAPGNIRYFIMTGLDISVAVPAVTPANRTYVVPAENRTYVVPAEDRTYVVPGN